MLVRHKKSDSKQNKNGTVVDNLAVFQTTLQQYTSVVLLHEEILVCIAANKPANEFKA